MNDFSSAFYLALRLIGELDPELRAIILLSLQISLTGSACALRSGHRWEPHWLCIVFPDAAYWS